MKYLFFNRGQSLKWSIPLSNNIFTNWTNCWHILHWSTQLLEKEGSLHPQWSPLPGSCSEPHRAESEGVFVQALCGNADATPLQLWPGPSLLIVVPLDQIQLENRPFWNCKQSWSSCDTGSKGCSRFRLSGGIQPWQKRWQWCIDVQEAHFKDFEVFVSVSLKKSVSWQ